MSTDLEAIAKTVPCCDCGAGIGEPCTDEHVQFWVIDTHLGRVELAQQVPF